MRRVRRPVVAWSACLAAFAALVVLVFVALPGWIVTPDEVPAAERREELQNGVRTAGMQLLAGLVLALGALFTARTLALNREGQITERFSRAVDHLGHEDLNVRLGGIYALERIARDSVRDYGPVMEVLTAYVRVHAPWPPRHELPGGKRADVQAAMTVIGRRNAARDEGLPRRLRLEWADLREGFFFGANYKGMDFEGTHLEGSSAETTIFDGAYLKRANLDGVGLGGTSLRNAILAEASLQRASLVRTDLRGADLRDARLDDAKLLDAQLSGATLDRLRLNGATVAGDTLRGLELRRVDLRGAKLASANLDGTMFVEVEADDETRWPDGFDASARLGTVPGGDA